MPFYAVAIGRIPGVYDTWDEAKEQVNGFSDAKHKKFRTEAAALDFMQIDGLDQDQADDREDTQVDELGHQFDAVKLDQDEDAQVHQLDAVKRECDEIKRLRELHGDDLVAFCAGSAPGNGKNTAAYAVSFPLEGALIRTARLQGKPTNNRADLTAAKVAMTIADELDDARTRTLIIYSRYDTLVSAMGQTRWVDRWERSGWHGTNGPIVNRDLYQELRIAENNDRRKKWRFLDVTAEPVWLSSFHDTAHDKAERTARSATAA